MQYVKAGSVMTWESRETLPEVPAEILTAIRTSMGRGAAPAEAVIIHHKGWVEDYDNKWGEWDHSRFIQTSYVVLTIQGDRSRNVQLRTSRGEVLKHGYLGAGNLLWMEIRWDEMTGEETLTVAIDGKEAVTSLRLPSRQEDGWKVWKAGTPC